MVRVLFQVKGILAKDLEHMLIQLEPTNKKQLLMISHFSPLAFSSLFIHNR